MCQRQRPRRFRREQDIECDDRQERDTIEEVLKKKKFKPSDGMVKQNDFCVVSKGPGIPGNNGRWSEHIVLHGKSAEKMMKIICVELNVKLPESNFYLDNAYY